jgi:hypothetical protein
MKLVDTYNWNENESAYAAATREHEDRHFAGIQLGEAIGRDVNVPMKEHAAVIVESKRIGVGNTIRKAHPSARQRSV